MVGIQIRMKRLFSPHSTNAIILPLDHGVSTEGIVGLERLSNTVSRFAISTKVNAILGHRNMMHCLAKERNSLVGSILHISASTRLCSSNNKVLVATVEDAVALGADAVSVHINLGEEWESAMLRDLGHVIERATTYGLPVLAMMYVRKGTKTSFATNDIMLSARVADDIGASIIKVPYTGSAETFTKVVHSCSAPILIAGGEQQGTIEALLTMVHDALCAGAKGISIGRNIFSAEYPEEILEVINLLVHKKIPLNSAISLYTTMVAHKVATI